jgi:hypothetical protein
MGHLTIRSNKPSHIQEFVKRNDPSKLRSTAGESLKGYQAANGGTGDTFYDLEQGWIRSLGYNTYDLFMDAIGYAVGGLKERIRRFLLEYTFGVSTDFFLLLENGDDFLLENGDQLILG